MVRKRIGILTGGGDVPPLNAVIAAAIKASEKEKISLIGFLRGWGGVLASDFVELDHVEIDPLIGGTILRSSRVDITMTEDGIRRVLSNLEAAAIEGLIVVGGEDTLSNCFHLGAFPQALISKTIDNDVGHTLGIRSISHERVPNLFTLGFPTAADKIASFVSWQEGLRTTAYSHERIMVVESMGMHAGWLALASGMGHPDFIVIPEFPIVYELLQRKIFDRFRKQRHVIVVVAEGAKWDDGSPIHAQKDELVDFDHPRFGGAASEVADKLKKGLQGCFNTRNINAVNPSYLYRSGAPNAVDRRAAVVLGKRAVQLLARRTGEPVFLSIQIKAREFSVIPTPLCDFSSIEDLHRFVDRGFYDPDELSLTDSGRFYFEGFMADRPVPKRYRVDEKGDLPWNS